MAARYGVMLVNLGTPAAPTAKAVREYLAEFLGDPRVIDAPRWLWWPILHGVILRIRPPKVAKAYASVWQEEGSPLLAIGRRQQRALAAALAERTGEAVPVELAMTYGQPSMEQAGLALRDAGVDKILVLPLYPQFSRTTTGAVFQRLAKALAPCPHLPELRFVNHYHDHPDYIAALAASVREHWEAQGDRGRLLMSYHGIPKRYVDNGDPYGRHCQRTSELLAQALELEEGSWFQSYQSRFGREEWLKPYTDETLKQWGADKTECVDVISPAFAADCLETLEEIDAENREYFQEAGGGRYRYIPALNDRPEHIHLLSQLVAENTAGW
ncbi:ferrochelatase [Salinicola endophyticus]|uniref:Ferrochelatase n=1 Tax=Salinicola endophyticus TaxID=1949083 RepID=A0ABY8FEP1_9GAMM|nr:ferrochelatase [Salinicola endophyticus]WFF40525.1 ferrochelatase [Salinicola endophyticus]